MLLREWGLYRTIHIDYRCLKYRSTKAVTSFAPVWRATHRIIDYKERIGQKGGAPTCACNDGRRRIAIIKSVALEALSLSLSLSLSFSFWRAKREQRGRARGAHSTKSGGNNAAKWLADVNSRCSRSKAFSVHRQRPPAGNCPLGPVHFAAMYTECTRCAGRY